jgi:hypothetical protein
MIAQVHPQSMTVTEYLAWEASAIVSGGLGRSDEPD